MLLKHKMLSTRSAQSLGFEQTYKKVAVVSASGLGDGLLSMILSHNLLLSGVNVTTFSSALLGLRPWFPGHTILPFPDEPLYQKTFSSFDCIIAADHSILNEQHSFGNQLILCKEKDFDKNVPITVNLQKICQKDLALPYAELNNGMQPPVPLDFRRHKKRVIIHPTSLELKRTWLANKFIKLGEKLEKKGFDPFFCVSKQERSIWESLVPKERLPFFSDLDFLARFIYESGYLIGNNSGLGHLASSMHIPTLSLFARKSYSKLWRPGFGPGLVVTPPSVLIGARLKERYWKQILTIRRVLNAFDKMGEKR